MEHLVDFLKACVDKQIPLSEKEAREIMKKAEYDIDVCKLAILFIKTPDEFMTLFSIAAGRANVDNLFPIILPHIPVDNKTDEELFALAKKGNYNHGILKHITPALKLETRDAKELQTIMEKTGYRYTIVDQVMPLLKLSEQKESFIWKLVKESNFNWNICLVALPFMLPVHTLEIIVNYNYNPHLCSLGIKRIKNKEKIFNLIIDSKFDHETCNIGVPQLSEKKKMELMKISKYHSFVCGAAIPGLKQAGNINLAFELCKNDAYLVEILIPHCKTESDILEIIEKHTYDEKILKAALSSPVLKTVDNIFSVLEKGYFKKELLDIVWGKLNLKDKDETILWKMMEDSKFNSNVCSKIVLSLKFKKKKEEEIVPLLKKNHYPLGLCLAVLPYIKDEKNLILFLQMNNHDSAFDELFKKVVVRFKQEALESYFIRCVNDRSLIKMVPYINKPSLLIEKLNKSSYSKELCKAITSYLTTPF